MQAPRGAACRHESAQSDATATCQIVINGGEGEAVRTTMAAAMLTTMVSLSARAGDPTAGPLLGRMQTHIPPLALAEALRTFAQSRQIQIVYLSEELRDWRTNGASGDLSAEEALSTLLEGTNLDFKFLDKVTVEIEPRSGCSLDDRTAAAQAAARSADPETASRSPSQGGPSTTVQPAVSANGGLAQEAGALEAIVVTAQKRSEDAQTVPVSLSVLTGTDIQEQGFRDVSDLAHLVPGVSVQRTGPAENTVIIRGVSSQAGVGSTVGYYYGEVPTSQLTQIDLPLFDLARVEVLRGPQGTLYGSSSMGGTIKYVPNQPEFNQFSTKIDVAAEHIHDSNGLGHKISDVVNLPLVEDKLAVRILVWSQYAKGYIDRYPIDPNNYLLADTSVAPVRGANTYDFYGYQVQLKFAPWENVTILPSFLSQKNESGGLFTVDLPQSNLAAGQLIQARDNPEPHTYDANIANLTVNASFGAWDLVSATSYFTQNVTQEEDTSKTQYVLLGAPPGYPIVPLLARTTFQPEETVQELRLSTKVAQFDGTIGLYYDHAERPSQQSIPFSPQWLAAYGNPVAFFGNAYNGYNMLFYNSDPSDNTERSIFGQGSYHITDKLSATLGVRTSYYYVSGSNYAYGFLNGPLSTSYASDSFHGVSPKYNITYDVTPNAMVYSTVAKGLRTGDIQAPSPEACDSDLAQYGLKSSPTKYDPDSLWSYEVGAKTTEFNRRMTLNGSAYYIDWSNIQQTVALECGFPFTGNLGKASVRGGELELQLLPIDQLTLYSSLSYTDSKLNSTTPGTPGVSGDPLLDVPLWTAAVSAKYRQPINENVSAFMRIEGSYEDKVERTFVPTDFFRTVPAYHLFNIRFGTRQTESKWEITAYVTNLLNTFAQSGLRLSDTGADLPNTRPVSIVQPRTFGLETVWRLK
jgi:iron complex outermembrane receptor protein